MKYKWLAGQLRRELLENGGKKGYKLPTELELARRYQLSRQTVRRALQLLEEEGLILRRQGSGAYATGKPPNAPPRQIAVITSFLPYSTTSRAFFPGSSIPPWSTPRRTRSERSGRSC